MQVGVLAVQGAFAEMEAYWRSEGADVFEIRQLADLGRPMDLLALPGGESTVQGKLLKDLGLFDPIKKLIDGGLPVFATCAGLILLAEKIDDPGSRDGTRPEQWFGALPVAVRRNAYGRQLGSFTTRGDFDGKHDFPMTFIRAPAITDLLSPDIEVLSTFDGDTPQDLGRKARIVQTVSGAYKGVTRHSLPKETEELRGFGFDMQKNPAAVEAITALGMLPWLNALIAANDELDELYKHRTSERGDREASAGGETTANVRKEASNLIVEIVARVNAAQRLMPSAELEGAVTALMGVISQYRLVASQHTAKREKPEPGPEAAS